ncbi:hypothetical protein HYG87_01840 [Methanobacterium alkalithermotolerans]|uniref:Uncharacterized protein n=1 Tax=Methanobacterium alkalithermotolerans TaxID=2731220 RepID=A0A8T8K279_9EURY|nr:hypothetical protein [Methanobacterium alkalithermotolerans]QUH22596.1 hypothetical protein HYG87_01840 [Methanobacterium alkalithermotolerans]
MMDFKKIEEVLENERDLDSEFKIDEVLENERDLDSEFKIDEVLENERDLFCSIKFKAIILGGAFNLILIFLISAVFTLTFNNFPQFAIPLLFIIIFGGGLVSGSLSRDYTLSAIINGTILGILMGLFFGIIIGTGAGFLMGLVLLTPFSLLGGFTGFKIKKKYF